MATKVVPLISSGTAGPLGVLHLPRLWTKLTLDSHDMLAPGYDESGQGFDQMTLDALGLDRSKTMQFVKDKHPTYMEFEKYVKEQAGSKLDASAIEKHNKAILGYNHADDLGKTMRGSSKIDDEKVGDAVRLNTVEDLDELHKQVEASH